MAVMQSVVGEKAEETLEQSDVISWLGIHPGCLPPGTFGFSIRDTVWSK